MSTEKQILTQTIADAQAVLDKAQADLKVLDKPELRHGDYGINRNGKKFIILDNRIYWEEDDYPDGTRNSPLPNKTIGPKQILGNIFDDLSAIAEPLEEFEVKIKNTPATYGTIQVGSACDPSDLVYISFKDGVDNQRAIHMTHGEFHDFITKCRQKEVAIKNKEVKLK